MRAALRLVLAGALAAACAVPGRADDVYAGTLAFAHDLMMQKRYAAAEQEYERLAAVYPGDARRPETLARMFNAAHLANNPTFDLTLARAWRERLNGPERCTAALSALRALTELENPEGALAEPFPADCPADDASRHRYLRGLARLRVKDWKGAAEEFAAVPAASTMHEQASAAAVKSTQGAALRWKSPALAGALSAVVPGTGYWYSDRPQTAAAAFTVCGLSVGGTYSAARAGEPGVAALLALLSLGWYTGGIYGSVQAAHRENAGRLDRFVRPFELRW